MLCPRKLKCSFFFPSFLMKCGCSGATPVTPSLVGGLREGRPSLRLGVSWPARPRPVCPRRSEGGPPSRERRGVRRVGFPWLPLSAPVHSQAPAPRHPACGTPGGDLSGLLLCARPLNIYSEAKPTQVLALGSLQT